MKRYVCAVSHTSETLHLHYAHEAGRRLESDSTKPCRLHKKGVWYQLCGDFAGANTCQLPCPTHLLLRSALHGRRTSSWIQNFLTYPSKWIFFFLFLFFSPGFMQFWLYLGHHLKHMVMCWLINWLINWFYLFYLFFSCRKAEGTTYDCFGALHFWPTLLGILSNIQCISKSEQDGQGLKEFGETCPFFDTCGYSWVLPTAHKPCKSFMWAAVCWQPLFIFVFFLLLVISSLIL